MSLHGNIWVILLINLLYVPDDNRLVPYSVSLIEKISLETYFCIINPNFRCGYYVDPKVRDNV